MENIAKNVVCLNDGENFGYVIDVAVDFETLKKEGYFVVEKETDTEFFVANEDVETFGKDVLIVESSDKMKFFDLQRDCIIGKMVIDEDGNFYGYVQNIFFAKNKLEKISTERCEIVAKNIRQIKKDVVLISFSHRRRASKKLDVSNDEKYEEQMPNEGQSFSPEKISLDMNFYVGKIALEDVVGLNHEKIVGRGEKITKNIVQKAKKHGKINELFFAAKNSKKI